MQGDLKNGKLIKQSDIYQQHNKLLILQGDKVILKIIPPLIPTQNIVTTQKH